MSVNHTGTLVAARYRKGLVLKGRTTDFLPTRDHFHVAVEGEPHPVRVDVADLKALFFIKTEEGDPGHRERKTFEHPSDSWLKLWIVFECDGEELAGWTMPSLSGRGGFFMVPTDQQSNIDKLYVFRAALKEVLKGSEAEVAAREYARRAVASASARPADDPAAKRRAVPDESPWKDEQRITVKMIGKSL